MTSSIADFVGVNDVRGKSLDVSVMRAFGAGFARYVRRHLPRNAGEPDIIVGRDTRPTSARFASAVMDGIAACGLTAIDIGVVSTDMAYFASGYWRRPAAVVTASHNPVDDNGIKFCASGARPLGRDSGLAEIARFAAEHDPKATQPHGPAKCDGLPDTFAGYLHSLVPAATSPLRVVVDAGYGAASVAAPAVFKNAVFKNVGVIGLGMEPDGARLRPDPADPARLSAVQQAVIADRADLGVLFDGDADRCVVIDETATPVDPSAIAALLTVRMLRHEPGADIVYNTICSRVLPDVIAEAGGTGHRTRVGHTVIKQQMAATDAIFGAEHSGHYYFRDFWYADSGILAVLHLLDELAASGAGLSALIAPFRRFHASGEINRPVELPESVLADLTRAFDQYSHDRIDGLTVSADDWWFNVRASNSEPVMRLNVEAANHTAMRRIRDRVLNTMDAAPMHGNT